MDLPPIIVDEKLPLITANHFHERQPQLPITGTTDIAAALQEKSSPRALITAVSTWDDRLLEHLNSGDMVTTMGSGYSVYPVDEFDKKGISLTHSPGINQVQVADHTFGMILTVTRQLWTYRRQQCEARWDRHYDGLTDLKSETCCIIGLGNLGEEIAQRGSAFGMNIRGVKRDVADYNGIVDMVFPPDEIDSAIEGATILILAVPLTPKTEGLISTQELTKLADDAIIVNVARGPVIDENALISALETDQIRAACLDVTETEPLPEDSPLWERSDVFITPHCAGWSDKYHERFLDHFLPQYDRWCNNEPLHDQIV